MSIAIVSVTTRGAELGQRLKKYWGTKAVCYEKRTRNSGKEAVLFDKLGTTTKDLFSTYDKILYIMAVGIVVRTIAPYIVHKSSDPAIIVMDEGNHFVVSLLSGHLGGANEWAIEVAKITEAIPVITTATDVNHIPAPDVFARKAGFEIDSFDQLVMLNAALVNGCEVSYYMDPQLYHYDDYIRVGKELTIHIEPLPYEIAERDRGLREKYIVYISDRILKGYDNTLFLRPKTMVVGIGCRKGIEKEAVVDAITNSLEIQKRSPKSLLMGSSVSIKSNEAGLLGAMDELGLRIEFYTPEEIKPIIEDMNLEESNFVKKTIGVGNVCETTALLLGKSNTLIQQKSKYPKITVAIAEVHWPLSALVQEMQKKSHREPKML